MKDPKDKEAIISFNRRIGMLICRKREAKGLTQSQLAEMIGIDRTTVSRIENGQKIDLPAYLLPLISESCDFSPRLYFEEEEIKQTLSVLKELLNWKASDTLTRAKQAEKSYETKIKTLENMEKRKFLRQEIVNVYLDGEDEIRVNTGNGMNYGLVNNPDYAFTLRKQCNKYKFHETPFDFSATSIENYPFTDSDLDALRNLAVLIDTAKVLDQMHGKKPLRRDLIDFIIDNCILEEAKNGDSLSKHICSYLSNLFQTALDDCDEPNPIKYQF